MAGAKKYKKAPIMIAEDVVANLAESQCFAQAEAVKPGFINLKLKPEFVAEYLNEMAADENLGVEKEAEPKTVMVAYGGTNVAEAASCRSSSFSDYRREHQADHPL